MAHRNKHPHIIVIMADQLRWDALGEHTPVINRLVEESTLFDRAYCASPICVPARSAFFTGCYPNRTGSIINPWEPLDRRHGDVRAGTPNLYSIFESEWDSHHENRLELARARLQGIPEATGRARSRRRSVQGDRSGDGRREDHAGAQVLGSGSRAVRARL